MVKNLRLTCSSLSPLYLAMPINVYTGLMRSGKSYEVVEQVILPAIRAGRRVVTNVDGINGQLIHDYLAKKNPKDKPESYGQVIHVQNEDVFKPDFFPYYDDQKSAHTDTLVQPGDLVAIDEAWRFWGLSQKIHKHHQSFFLEHGHFTHEVTGVACDLVLMIQDMGTLHRSIKAVVAFSFRTHKKVSLGMSSTYSINMWEGSKMNKQTLIGQWVRRYRKEIFPLYSSFKGGAQGKVVNTDERQNILKNTWLWVKVAGAVLVAVVGFRSVWKFFHPVEAKPVATVITTAAPSTSTSAKPAPPAEPNYSNEWRIVGQYNNGFNSYVMLVNTKGQLRAEPTSLFAGFSLRQSGQIDGKQVTRWSVDLPTAITPGDKK